MALDELRVEMIDRFGLLPEPTQALFAATEIKLLAQPLGIRKLDMHATGGRILFDTKPNVDPMKIIQLIQKRPWEFKLEGSDKLRLLKEIANTEERVLWLKKFLQELVS
jgi:transcription-repair coupling factor (superfamily II helicase)